LVTRLGWRSRTTAKAVPGDRPRGAVGLGAAATHEGDFHPTFLKNLSDLPPDVVDCIGNMVRAAADEFRKRRQNIGKPVITIDVDRSREGA
jgi:hypothetical protein